MNKYSTKSINLNWNASGYSFTLRLSSSFLFLYAEWRPLHHQSRRYFTTELSKQNHRIIICSNTEAVIPHPRRISSTTQMSTSPLTGCLKIAVSILILILKQLAKYFGMASRFEWHEGDGIMPVGQSRESKIYVYIAIKSVSW